MRRSNLTGIVVALLTMGWVGQSADAAERRCEFRFHHEKPDWIAEMQPLVRQRLAGVMGQLSVLEDQDKAPSSDRTVRCGCYIDQVDWDEVRAVYPSWYRSEPIASGKLAAEFRRLSDQLLEVKTAFRRKHCQ